MTKKQGTLPIHVDSVGRWKRDLTSVYDRVLFASTGQIGLHVAGYSANTEWVLDQTSTPASEIEAEFARAKNEIARLVQEDRRTLEK